MNTQATLSAQGLSLADSSLMDKVTLLRVSNSTIDGIMNCPARFIAEKYCIPSDEVKEPDSATIMGTAFHKVMELYFTLPPAQRTVSAYVKAYADMLACAQKEEDIALFAQDSAHGRAARSTVRSWINAYVSSGMEDVSSIIIPDMPVVSSHGQEYTKKGLEYFVQGSLGSASRDTLGFIDRLSVDSTTGHYVIADWKTGKHVKEYNPKDKYPDFSYTRQQILYAMLLESQGYTVDSARLLFINPKAERTVYESHGKRNFKKTIVGATKVDIDIRDESLRSQAMRDVEFTSSVIDDSLAHNMFSVNPSPLCSWCPLVKICPSAMKINKDNARTAVVNAPQADILENYGLVHTASGFIA